MLPRAYQTKAIESAVAQFAAYARTLIVMATGAGKTVVAAHVADRMMKATGQRVLVIAHRDELIRQAADKFSAVTGHMPEVEKGIERTNEVNLHGVARVVVSSIQSLHSPTHAEQDKDKPEDEKRRRCWKFDPKDFCLLWVDEAHHAVARTYRRVVNFFTARNPDLKVLYVTATADRADGLALAKVCESVAFRYELNDIIDDGYLVPIRQNSAVIEGLDFTRVRTVAGDLNQGDTEAAMNEEKPFHGIVHATIEVACGLPKDTLSAVRVASEMHSADPGEQAKFRADELAKLLPGKTRRRTLVFTVTVAHADRMAEILNRWIPESAQHIHGGMDPEQRRKIIKAYAEGKIQFLTNCMVTTEGFDEPGVELVVMARPTKSRALFVQMVGRGTRPALELAPVLGTLADAGERRRAIESSVKPFCEVLDFVGNSGRHRLVTVADLLGEGRYEGDVIERAKLAARAGGVDAKEALERSKEEIAAEREAERKKREERARVLREQQERDAEARRREQEERYRRRRDEAEKRKGIVGTASYHLREVNGFDAYSPSVDRDGGIKKGKGSSKADKFDRSIPLRTIYRAVQPGVSDEQLEIFRQNKVPPEDVAKFSADTAEEVRKRIGHRHARGLCTYCQALLLGRHGYNKMQIHNMTKAEASRRIDAIARNGWRRPPEPPEGEAA